MNAELQLRRLLLFSPWSLLAFLVVPLAVILSLTLNIELPVLGFGTMLANNICFTCLAACRFAWYLSRLGRGIRYGAALRRPETSFDPRIPASQARGLLSGAGFSFAAGGGYGEKRDLGFLGTTLLYGGLCLLLGAGCWDNLHQFSGVLLDGVGVATRLSQVESYRSLNKGPLAAKPDLPQLRLTNQVLPDNSYPKGATGIDLIPEKGAPLSTVLVPGEPFRYGAWDIYMSKLVFEPEIVIKTRDGRILFDGFVKLDPLVQKRGDFSFYGLFQGAEVGGGSYYQPEQSLLMVVITRNGKREVTEMRFQRDQQVVSGDYLLSCAKMGEWSEIHVVHRRHLGLLILGGAIALLGLALRVAVVPQRVWLEEAGGACRVTAVGGEARQALGC